MNELLMIYDKLYQHFGPQHWWPGDTPFEVSVGAILTQNTSWSNVEKVISHLKNLGLLSPSGMSGLPAGELASMIKPAGYFNVKALRLRSFLEFLMGDYHGEMEHMAREDSAQLRAKLLRVHGIGPETADSILLYAIEKPVFVIDAYTKRVLSRHGIMGFERSYNEFQEIFHASLNPDIGMFKEYHALFVQVGKTFCKRNNPACGACPLNAMLPPLSGTI